jgi:hypothetical protein
MPATVDEGIAGHRRAVDGIDGLLPAIARRVRSPERRGVATGGKQKRSTGHARAAPSKEIERFGTAWPPFGWTAPGCIWRVGHYPI